MTMQKIAIDDHTLSCRTSLVLKLKALWEEQH